MTVISAPAPTHTSLSGIPQIDTPANVWAALAAGRRSTGILREVTRLRRGPGKLTPQEYFYYRLWDEALPSAAKDEFVGKEAQHPMHLAACSREWFAAAADKVLFQSILDGAGGGAEPVSNPGVRWRVGVVSSLFGGVFCRWLRPEIMRHKAAGIPRHRRCVLTNADAHCLAAAQPTPDDRISAVEAGQLFTGPVYETALRVSVRPRTS